MKLFQKFYRKLLLLLIGAFAVATGTNSCNHSTSNPQPLYGVDQDTTRRDSIVPYYGVRTFLQAGEIIEVDKFNKIDNKTERL